MTTMQIEAQISTEQLLRAVEQLPPREFAVFLAHVLAHARTVTQANQAGAGKEVQDHPWLAAAGMFADDSFASVVDAYIAAQREQERPKAGD